MSAFGLSDGADDTSYTLDIFYGGNPSGEVDSLIIWSVNGRAYSVMMLCEFNNALFS